MAPSPPTPRESPRNIFLVTTAMLSFISFWRAAAIVLCDLGSTAYYIGGLSEQMIGKAAPWFILAVMLFSYAVRALYIESCSMFVRGGVYRVVKEAIGSTMAKLSVSALLFDYVLTGPISAVAAGHYLVGLLNTILPHVAHWQRLPPDLFAVIFALAITLYFGWENIKGVEESSNKALQIMAITTVMAIVLIGWSFFTLAHRGFRWPPLAPQFTDEAWGWLKGLKGTIAPVGILGVLMAFGHTLLALSGEETLAQVYRELEAPKLKNLQRTGFIIFLYSLLLTGLTSFFAVMIIPDAVRLARYSDNLMSGLAMYESGPLWARIAFQSVVVLVGFLLLAGAVNTAIVGSNGVLNRVGEDGVLPEGLRRPHPKYGTSSRLISLTVGLQLATILLCCGNVLVLGEAYAFGVVWSFAFNALAVLVLRFTQPEGREWRVPGNIRLGKVEIPLGLCFIFLVLFVTACVNLFTKKIATISGALFTIVIFSIFELTERFGAKREAGQTQGLGEDHHIDPVNMVPIAALTPATATKAKRIVVAVHNPRHLFPLQRILEESDPKTTDVIAMLAKLVTGHHLDGGVRPLRDEQILFTEVIAIAEKIGHSVIPLVVPTKHRYFALAKVVKDIGATELVMGPSHVYSRDGQVRHLADAWRKISARQPPLRVRILSEASDFVTEIGPANRSPGE